MLQQNADRDALNAEKAKPLGMIVAGKITAAEAAARLFDDLKNEYTIVIAEQGAAHRGGFARKGAF